MAVKPSRSLLWAFMLLKACQLLLTHQFANGSGVFSWTGAEGSMMACLTEFARNRG